MRGLCLGPYYVTARIGAGNMGIVYRAVDTRRGALRALKLLSAKSARDPRKRKRFRIEGDLGARLRHPSIVTMFEQDASLAALTLKIGCSGKTYLPQHGLNVAVLTSNMAMAMGFSKEEATQAAIGAMFHDVGMLRVPESIRLAPRQFLGTGTGNLGSLLPQLGF